MSYNYDVKLNNMYAFNGPRKNGPYEKEDLSNLSDKDLKNLIIKLQDEIAKTKITDTKKRFELNTELTKLLHEEARRNNLKNRENQSLNNVKKPKPKPNIKVKKRNVAVEVVGETPKPPVDTTTKILDTIA